MLPMLVAQPADRVKWKDRGQHYNSHPQPRVTEHHFTHPECPDQRQRPVDNIPEDESPMKERTFHFTPGLK